MDRIEALNRALFLHINGGDATPPWLVNTAIGIAEGLIYLIPVLLAALWLWGGQARRRLAVKACLVTLLALGANQVIGLVWMHPRPFMVSRDMLGSVTPPNPRFRAITQPCLPASG
mgnify:CR=1 FL=1